MLGAWAGPRAGAGPRGVACWGTRPRSYRKGVLREPCPALVFAHSPPGPMSWPSQRVAAPFSP